MSPTSLTKYAVPYSQLVAIRAQQFQSPAGSIHKVHIGNAVQFLKGRWALASYHGETRREFGVVRKQNRVRQSLQLLRRANVQARVLVVVGLAGALLRRGGRAARAASDGHAEDLEARRRAFLRLLQALLEAGLGAVREGHLEHVEVAGPAAGADVVRLDALEGETQRHVVDDVVEALVELGLAAARGVVARDEEVVGAGLRRAARLPEGLPLAALALAGADVPDHVVLGVIGAEARDLLGVRLKAAQGPGRALVHVGGVHGLGGLVLALAEDVGVDRPIDLARLVLDLGGRVPPAIVQVSELVRDVVLVGLRVLGPLAALEHVPLVRLQLLLLLVRVALLPASPAPNGAWRAPPWPSR
ncbi:hypothetical protein PG997_008276 [Apiospora hydei]|uniref:Uncharacterized protein n=1 Tax=Apiospora hydei TaxID=1337664 RepID=A0ABR1WAE2_9PEZI